MEQDKEHLISESICDGLFTQQRIEVKRAVAKVLLELTMAERKHPEWPNDVVHASAIVAEESGELTRACLQYYYEGAFPRELAKEAAQTAAMGIRFLVHPYLDRNGIEKRIFVGAIGDPT